MHTQIKVQILIVYYCTHMTQRPRPMLMPAQEMSGPMMIHIACLRACITHERNPVNAEHANLIALVNALSVPDPPAMHASQIPHRPVLRIARGRK